MAIYHLTVKTIRRSKGQRAVKCAAYRRGAKMLDEGIHIYADYRRKKEVVHRELSIPSHSPDWLKKIELLEIENQHHGSEVLWNIVEKREKMPTSQLAREVEFALPIELSVEQNVILAREFIQQQFVSHGMIADWSMHWDEGNPHVHLMLTMRELMDEGFGNKCRSWNNKSLLCKWRSSWADSVNQHLQRHQQTVRIDHRSYEEQGIDLTPGIHQGSSTVAMEERGKKTSIFEEANEIRYKNLERIATHPESLLDRISTQQDTFDNETIKKGLNSYLKYPYSILSKLSGTSEKKLSTARIKQLLKSLEYHEAVFNEKHLKKAIVPYTTSNPSLIDAFLQQVKQSSKLVAIGVGEDGRERFTTKRMLKLEYDLERYAEKLGKRRHAKISIKQVDFIIKHYQQLTKKTLTDEQQQAVRYLTQPTSLACLVGRAGTGKGVCLGATKMIWEASGLRVQGISLSGIAADGLFKETGMPTRTIESFRYSVSEGILKLSDKDVIVMDEAGMTDSAAMQSILKQVSAAKAKLVLVGDPAQLQPVGPGASFRALVERLGFVELQNVYRQKADWQRAATIDFSSGHVAKGIAAYATKACVHLSKTESLAFNELANHWQAALSRTDLNKILVIAHRNAEVEKLNQLLRKIRIEKGEITEGHAIRISSSVIQVSAGDRLLFTKNDSALGVTNGCFATVKGINFTQLGHVKKLIVVLDGSEKTLAIDPKQYSHFKLGYAATIHKTQGMTVDHTLIYAGGFGWNRHLTYVAFSRHRESCNLYANQTYYKTLTQLQKDLGRSEIKDSLLDFPLAFARRRGIMNTHLTRYLQKQLVSRLSSLKSDLNNNYQRIINSVSRSKNKEQIIKPHEKESEKVADSMENQVKNKDITVMLDQWKKYEKAIVEAKNKPLAYMEKAKREQLTFVNKTLKNTNIIKTLEECRPGIMKEMQKILGTGKCIKIAR